MLSTIEQCNALESALTEVLVYITNTKTEMIDAERMMICSGIESVISRINLIKALDVERQTGVPVECQYTIPPGEKIKPTLTRVK